MIKKENTRIIFTLSHKQAKWLKDGAKKLNISVSQFIKWLIDKNISRIISREFDEKQYKDLIKIAKMPWIDFSPEKEYEWDENMETWYEKEGKR